MTIEVKPGQVWKDNDKHANGRTVTILQMGFLPSEHGRVLVQTNIGRKTWMKLERFESGGVFVLEKDAEAST